MRPRWRALAGLAALAAPLLLLAAAGCERKPSGTRLRASAGAPAISLSDYIGSDACASCHAAEFRLHRASRHNLTLRVLNEKLLGSLAPPTGRVPDSDIVLLGKAGSYRITRVDADGEGAPVQLVFGSGKTGMTFAAVRESGEMVEISRSYFPSRRAWYVTPGHEARPKAEVGLRCTPEEAGRCLRCHGAPLRVTDIALDSRFHGVGCESCHGPARAHVEAMRAGRSSGPRPPRLGTLGAADAIKVCSPCHRGRDSVNLQSQQAHMTNRFQAFGLMQSRCYLESQDKLSCVTCHNPHADAVTDAARYTPTCLSCHSGGPATPRTARGRICPVNARDRCVACHMPERPVFKSASLPVEMADHLIRVFRAGGPKW